jgi:hypothetical protein
MQWKAPEWRREPGRSQGRGVAKRPDLNELDVPELAELVLDKIEWRKPLYSGDGDSEPQAARWTRGLIGSAEIFPEGTAYTTTKWDVHHAGGWWQHRRSGRQRRDGASRTLTTSLVHSA